MKSGDIYRFSLAWPMETEEQILAGEFLNKLKNKKSKLIVQLICDYIAVHPEVINSKETLKFIVNSTSVGDTLTEMIRSMIQSELAGKIILLQSGNSSGAEQIVSYDEESIDDMFDNLDMWNTT